MQNVQNSVRASACRSYRSMVVAFEPEPGYCKGHDVVPNILHRVWVGRPCPHVYDLVSMLSAVLLLKPETIRYHRTFQWAKCIAGRGKEMALDSCYEGLGVQYNEINMTGSMEMEKDSSKFEQDTRDFATRRAFSDWSHIKKLDIKGPPHLSDLIRLHALHHEGGYYFDADSFLLSGKLSRFRRCPFVMSVGEFDQPRNRSKILTTSAEVLAETSMPHSAWSTFNNGAMMAAPHSHFGKEWWNYMRGWNGGGWAIASCGWPKEWEKQHPQGMQGTPAMRNFPFRKWNRNLTWAEHIERMVTNGADAIHLSNAKIRLNMLIIAGLVLERAVQTVGGDQALTSAQAQCVNLARDWIRRSPGEHDDNIVDNDKKLGSTR